MDSLKRVSKNSVQLGNAISTLDLKYDINNRINSTTSTNGANVFVTNYKYNQLRLDQVQTNGQSIINNLDSSNVKYYYYDNGSIQSIAYPPLSDGSILKTEYIYNALNQLSNITNKKGTTVLSSETYTYDNNGNILSIRKEVLNQLTNWSSSYIFPAITFNDNKTIDNKKKYFIYVKMKSLSGIQKKTEAIVSSLQLDNAEQGSAMQLGREHSFKSVRIEYNNELLKLYGKSIYKGVNNSLILAFSAVIVIVMICTIAVIYNTFHISVLERISQFGMLRCIGATPTQIRKIVMQEAAELDRHTHRASDRNPFYEGIVLQYQLVDVRFLKRYENGHLRTDSGVCWVIGFAERISFRHWTSKTSSSRNSIRSDKKHGEHEG